MKLREALEVVLEGLERGEYENLKEVERALRLLVKITTDVPQATGTTDEPDWSKMSVETQRDHMVAQYKKSSGGGVKLEKEEEGIEMALYLDGPLAGCCIAIRAGMPVGASCCSPGGWVYTREATGLRFVPEVDSNVATD